jgi:hypothetical protein
VTTSVKVSGNFALASVLSAEVHSCLNKLFSYVTDKR